MTENVNADEVLKKLKSLSEQDNSEDVWMYGTEENLIEYVLSDEETYTYVVGNYLPAVKDDGGDALAYTFTVDALEDGFATLTFTKTA